MGLREVEDITPQWLSDALGASVARAHIQDVIGGAATKVRVALEGDGVPPSVIVKAPLPEPRADSLAFFAGEVGFYARVAAHLDVGAPRCLYAEGAVVVLEDVRDARFLAAGDTLAPDAVAEVLAVLSGLHATTWGTADGPVYPGPMRPVLTGMLSGRYWAGCLARPRSASIPEPFREPGALRAYVERLWDQPLCRVHGDAHVGNVYLPADGPPGLLDWQMSARGHWAHDVAYFVTSALDPADRRAHERDLLATYLEALGHPVDDPVGAYARHLPHGLYWATNADGMYPEATNTHMVERFTTALADWRITP